MSKQADTFPQKLMKLFGSYGLAVVLLFCLFVLTIFGTLHQVDHGLYAAKHTFFLSWVIWGHVGDFSFPVFPGGVTCMGLLTLNLFVGGLVRIRWQMRNLGIIIIHIGIVFLLSAGMVKVWKADEGHLSLMEGEQSNFFQSYNLWEVVVWELAETAQVTEFIIPDEYLVDLDGENSRSFFCADLPFELQLSGFVPHCKVLPKGPMWQADGPVIEGYGLLAMDLENESERNVAGMHAAIVHKGQRMEALLYGGQGRPWAVEIDGKRFAIDLRHTRYGMPFEIRLEKFIKEDHPGMTMAKAFKSEITRIDTEGAERRLIQMNEPLREGGLVLFQSGWGPQEPGYKGPFWSVFSVVHNPSDKWPEYSMWVITLGLLITFVRRLGTFVRTQATRRAKVTGDAA